jgi:di/tripeptidase
LEISGIIEKLKEALGGDFEAVSFGTTILDQHSTSERVPTADVEKFYNQFCKVLEKLAA